MTLVPRTQNADFCTQFIFLSARAVTWVARRPLPFGSLCAIQPTLRRE